jgi:hypothetical protein
MAIDNPSEHLRMTEDRRAYIESSQGNQWRPRGIYFFAFSVWHAGNRLQRLPVGLRQIGAAIRNLRVFWKPRQLEFNYMSDGLATKAQMPFLADEEFRRSYERMILASGTPNDPGIHHRIHGALWAASVAKRLDGDFVECGTGRGLVFSAVLESLPEWPSLGKTLWLFDRFLPYKIDRDTGRAEASSGTHSRYAIDFTTTERNFAQWQRVSCIAGDLPESLSQVHIARIALLHIDLNFAPVEQEVLRRLWPLVTKGGIVLLDDYGSNAQQNKAMIEIAEELDFRILSTGTSQGIIVKA